MSPKSLFLALLITALVPAVANADGLPVPVDDAGPAGVVSTDGNARYVTTPAHGGTLVQWIDTNGGQIAGSRFLKGRFTVPVVALDGTPAGLSHDGTTLVLIRPRAGFPRARTTLAILDSRLRSRPAFVTLRGDFSFDALSPDGSTTFLVNYVDPKDPTRYRVRVLDSTTGRLGTRPVVDPNEPPDAMRGLPLTRVTSPDGRWHYTLYDGAGKHPFVHALDVEGQRAKCIDLPQFAGSVDPYSVRLSLLGGGRTLRVGSLATVDTRTFKVRAGAPARQPAARKPASHSGSSAVPWIAAIGVLLLAGGVALSRRSRRRSAGRTATVA
jgi:LPXTG-motif cell wall-anchored protein